MTQLLESLPYESIQFRLRSWLQDLATLSSVPDIVTRIMPGTVIYEAGKGRVLYAA